MRALLFSFCFLFLSLSGIAQEQAQSDSTEVRMKKKRKRRISGKVYDPRKASKRSAFIPGWGQATNDSWWKVPIIYGGLGLGVHFIGVNNTNRKAFLALAEEEQNSANPNTNLLRVYRRRADNWRRNRDLVVITMAAGYALQIIEAAVDAHLKNFNVDSDLSMTWKPKIGVISNGSPYVGVGITLPIGK